MSELERLHQIISTLPGDQVHALLTLLESTPPISDDEFYRLMAAAPEEDADEETIALILAAKAERGEEISHAEMKRQLGL